MSAHIMETGLKGSEREMTDLVKRRTDTVSNVKKSIWKLDLALLGGMGGWENVLKRRNAFIHAVEKMYVYNGRLKEDSDVRNFLVRAVTVKSSNLDRDECSKDYMVRSNTMRRFFIEAVYAMEHNDNKDLQNVFVYIDDMFYQVCANINQWLELNESEYLRSWHRT